MKTKKQLTYRNPLSMSAIAILPVESKRRFRHRCTYNRRRESKPAINAAPTALILWSIGGRSVVEKFVRNRTQPWVVFRVPEKTPPLTGLEAKLSGDVVTICNHGNDKWSKVLVQIDAGYLAAIGLLLWGASLVTSCRGCEPLWGSIHVVGNVDQNLRLVRVASSSALARESHAF
jgi:hypothetical protein